MINHMEECSTEEMLDTLRNFVSSEEFTKTDFLFANFSKTDAIFHVQGEDIEKFYNYLPMLSAMVKEMIEFCPDEVQAACYEELLGVPAETLLEAVKKHASN